MRALHVAGALLDLLLPSICPACRSGSGPLLCAACRPDLPTLPNPCAYCGAPRRAADHACRSCGGKGFTHLQRVVVGYAYSGLIEALIGDAKAGGRPAAARALSELLPALPDDGPSPAMLVPIPPSRGRRPGPHLGTCLARAIAKREGLTMRAVLVTTRLAAEQHRLGAGERRTNVTGLFSCCSPPAAYVVLIDDLLTSGATASAAAGALRDAGTRRVDLLCLARTLRGAEKAMVNGRDPAQVTAPRAGSS